MTPNRHLRFSHALFTSDEKLIPGQVDGSVPKSPSLPLAFGGFRVFQANKGMRICKLWHYSQSSSREMSSASGFGAAAGFTG